MKNGLRKARRKLRFQRRAKLQPKPQKILVPRMCNSLQINMFHAENPCVGGSIPPLATNFP